MRIIFIFRGLGVLILSGRGLSMSGPWYVLFKEVLL